MILKSRKKGFFVIALLAFAIPKAKAQSTDPLMPKIIEKNGHHALMVDGKPFFILGAQAHNSSAWPGILPQVFSSMREINANTLEIPIYWEQIEPTQGKFNFSLIDTILVQSRKQQLRLVLLWFATWKNGSNHYMPEWMKKDAEKYPNIIGKNGKHVDSPSPNFKATLDADMKAFAAVMGYLKKADKQHTVIMVQVENEPGAWGSVRDYSATAQELFEQPVPDALLKPSVLGELNVAIGSKGNWKTVFGERADEYFHAWSVASFIEKVASAGKAVYPLPLYVNAALRDPLTNPPATNYESGGPTDNVLPIWKAAAPSIDILAPDIYLNGSERILKVIELYARKDNALFVPEASFTEDKVKYLYTTLASGGIGFAPFGVDINAQVSNQELVAQNIKPFSKEYQMAAPMMRELAAWSYEGKIKAVVEREDFAPQKIDLVTWEAIISFGGDGRANAAPINTEPIGKLLIVTLNDHEFLLMGTKCHITFQGLGINKGKEWQYGKVEEGNYENGEFKLLRIQNGDETDWGGPGFGATPTLLKVSLIVR